MTITERLYARLPEHQRLLDTTSTLHDFLEGALVDAETAEEIANDWLDQGTLADPLLADSDWLLWLAQHVTRIRPSLTDAERRDAILYASAGWLAGTKTAIANAAKTVLTGTKHVEVYDHSISSPGDGGQWDVLIVTRSDETPDPAAVLETIIAKRAKPAGVQLHHEAYSTSWTTVEGSLPTWTAWEAKTWDQIQVTGL